MPGTWVGTDQSGYREGAWGDGKARGVEYSEKCPVLEILPDLTIAGDLVTSVPPFKRKCLSGKGDIFFEFDVIGGGLCREKHGVPISQFMR